jgi:peptidoglycan hydrolase-like protein with peptidoglycan-binding domain
LQYITRYQNALAWLALQGHPTWNPGKVDGKYGPNTAAAVTAFQRDHGLTADGKCGNMTAAAIDAMLGGPAVGPSPAPGPAPGPAPVPGTPAAPLVGPPPLVSPYPGPGAYASNHDYITRYQLALIWLAQNTGDQSLNPQGADGKFGPHTQAAVASFQRQHGLTADGKAGADTASALDAAVSSTPAAA